MQNKINMNIVSLIPSVPPPLPPPKYHFLKKDWVKKKLNQEPCKKKKKVDELP